MNRRTRTLRKLLILVTLCSIVMYEGGTSVSRDLRRRSKFLKAARDAQKYDKPLIVIGDPDNGGFNSVFGRSYQCGDMCIDLTSCPKCKNGTNEDILSYLQKCPDKSIVIFESCVLESIPAQHRRKILWEMQRVGKRVHHVRIGNTFIMRWLYLPRIWTGEPQMEWDW